MSSLGKMDDLKKVLACPKCKGNVKFNKKENKIVCHECRLKFPVNEGIPNMLLEDAEEF